jgi:hydroxypyruvate reductase
MQSADARALLRAMFDAAVAAAQPDRCLPFHLPPPPRGRLIVIGAGKGAAAMAQTVEDHYDCALSGLVVTPYGHAVSCKHIEVMQAAHPVPDENSLAAAEKLLACVRGLTQDDLVLCLISGGGSSLLCLPAEGLSLTDKRSLNEALLSSGAPIDEINVVRRHLSRIKGGRLAAAAFPARVITLAISDVPGDFLPDIASGPTVGDPTTCADALAIINRYRISLPAAARHLLDSGAGESIKPDDPRLRGNEADLVATPLRALQAAASVAAKAGVAPLVLGDRIEGEAREVAKVMAGMALHAAHEPMAPRPCVFISGGETTVTLRGDGKGGRNVEFLLSLALSLHEARNISALAADTDGVDGSQQVAGAFVTPETLSRARALALDARHALARNDAHSFFAALNDQIITGPTRTNVNDFRAILIT